LIFMKKTGLILATMLLALCVLGSMSPANGQNNNQVPAPNVSLEMNGVPITRLDIRVCSEFTLELGIRGIPPGYGMVGFSIRIEWMDLMELVGEDHSMLTPRGWSGDFRSGAGFIEGGASGPPYTEPGVWARFTFHCLGEGISIMAVPSPSVGLVALPDGGEPYDTDPEPFEATVHQYRAVGGVLTGTDKLALLSPYLALISLVGAVTVAVAIRRRKP